MFGQLHEFITHIIRGYFIFAQPQFWILGMGKGLNTLGVSLLHLVYQGHDIVELAGDFTDGLLVDFEFGQLGDFMYLIRRNSQRSTL